LLAQLPPSDEHGPDSERDVGTIEQQSFNFPIEGQSPHRAWQKAKGLEHSKRSRGSPRCFRSAKIKVKFAVVMRSSLSQHRLDRRPAGLV